MNKLVQTIQIVSKVAYLGMCFGLKKEFTPKREYVITDLFQNIYLAETRVKLLTISHP